MVEENTSTIGDEEVLKIDNLHKHFGSSKAVNGISLRVQRGEFITLLGPSGSGKTTTLRIIAGFTQPTSGSIYLYGNDITDEPPDKRDIGMVFQNYALFPHMTAFANIAFPLEMRKVGSSEIKARVNQALDMVQLTGYGNRLPRQLSGGQQQRIAIARAVVFRPRLLLMDEPLGALDKKLREELQVVILDVKRRTDATILYVTHDQEEALAMSNRIAIFNNGKIEQIGSSNTLYENPNTLFTAKFMGESTVLNGRVKRDGLGFLFTSSLGSFAVNVPKDLETSISDNPQSTLVIRPERLVIRNSSDEAFANNVQAKIVEVRYIGSFRKYNLVLSDGTPAVVRESTLLGVDGKAIGDDVVLSWQPDQGIVLIGKLNNNES